MIDVKDLSRDALKALLDDALKAKRAALKVADERSKENCALRQALESLTKDPPPTLAREPDTDCEVVLKMRAIAKRALEQTGDGK